MTGLEYHFLAGAWVAVVSLVAGFMVIPFMSKRGDVCLDRYNELYVKGVS